MDLGQQFILVLNLDLYFSAFISEKLYSSYFILIVFIEHAGQRDRYDRDRDREPYFDRQSNVMTDHRDFKMDRETHRDRDRDRGVIDYDRDRFDRERRPRDDRYAMKNTFAGCANYHVLQFSKSQCICREFSK